MKTVGFFTTCLADTMRPSVAVAAVRLLRAAGAEVVYPQTQTCCGQIAFSSGYDDIARALFVKFAREFAKCEAVVIPSGSCCGMLRTRAGELLQGDDADSVLARAVLARCVELSEYLDRAGYVPKKVARAGAITFHDSCAGLRELGVKSAPRRLLTQAGYDICEMDDCEECCGFGGRFAVQFGEVSAALAKRKYDNILNCVNSAKDANNVNNNKTVTAVAAGDVGCLLQMEGFLRRAGSSLPALHWAELLTGLPQA